MGAPRHTHAPMGERKRDLSPGTLQILGATLRRHGVTPEAWEKGEPTPEVTAARKAACQLLWGREWTKARIARALGVDDRRITQYLRQMGLEKAPASPKDEPAPDKPEERVRLPFAGPMQPGPGPRHDCVHDGDCLRELLKQHRERGYEPPYSAHCDPECKSRLAPGRTAAWHAAMVGAVGIVRPIGRPM